MKVMQDLKEMLEDELKKITKKGDITPQELESAYKAVDILKDLTTIKAMEEYDTDGQSHDGMSHRGSYGSVWNQDMTPYPMHRGSYRGSYDYDGHSRDGRAGRDGDGDGRYSEEVAHEGSYGYSAYRGRDARGRFTSRDGSYDYSRHSEKERMIDKLETMADVTSDPKMKQAIEQCIDKLER